MAMAGSVQRALSAANLILHKAASRATSGLAMAVIALVLLPSTRFSWTLAFASVLITYYYYSYFITGLFKLPRRLRTISSDVMRFLARRALQITILAIFILWCFSITPVHIPTFIGAFTPYAVHEPLRMADVVYDAGEDAIVDIFAIQGLGSQPDSTWIYTPNTTRIRWLSEFLPQTEEFRNIRVVMLYHQTRGNFQEYAFDLLGHIESQHKTHPDRPIVFIAHSFGGLLVKKALLLAKSHSMDVATMTRGIIFLEVPHRGTYTAIAASCLSYLSFFHGPSFDKLEYMSFDSTALLDLESEFYDAYVLQHHPHEKQPYICDVVESRSKRGLLRHGIVFTLDTGHQGLDKFQSSSDRNFQVFLSILRQAIGCALPVGFTTPQDTQIPTSILEYALYGLPWVARSRITAALIGGLEEFTASWIAGDRNRHGNYLTARCAKMILYRGIITSSVSQGLAWTMRKAFEGHSTSAARLLQILLGNVIIVPMQIIIDMLAEAYIAGARTPRQFRATARLGFRVHTKLYCWMAPAALFIAHSFLPQTTRTVFFNLILFLFYTSGNTTVKKKRLDALRRKHAGNVSMKKRAESNTAEKGTRLVIRI
ncbi:hypothetical protein F4818DRAFT_433747 [Hypoxylon cercidicola]|nr:hypothetical protein F4818DRAFT_433747 [Hypoxylon cercidicola]